MKTSAWFVIAANCLFSATMPIEAVTIHTGEDVGESVGSAAGNKRLLSELPKSASAFSAFQLALTNIAVETFEGYAASDPVTNIFFGTNSAQIAGGIVVRPQNPPGHTNGQFALSGDQFLSLTQAITVRFSTLQSAFGFFLTDVENTSRNVVLIETNGNRRTYAIPATVPGQLSGGCLFFGIIDRESPFIAVELSGGGPEGYGFDDMMIEQPGQRGVPASIAIDTYAGIAIIGTPQATYRVEISPTVDFMSWETQKIIRLPTSPFLYFDEEAIQGRLHRYYRVIAE